MEVILGLGFLLGLMLGSLIDSLASRSLKNQSFKGRSYCDQCKKTLSWYDLFPIFSFIFARGRCRHCHKKLSLEYPLIEVLVGLLIAFTFWQTIPINFLTLSTSSQTLLSLEVLFKSFVVSVLLTVLITDIKGGIIPDRITYPAAAVVLAYFVIKLILSGYFLYISLWMSPLGKYLLPPYSDYFYRHVLTYASPFGLGILSALGIGLFFMALIIVTRGRGMGGGDLKLGIFLGLILGFPNSLIALALAFLAGSLVGIALIVLRKKHFGQTIPFGPFLSLGGIIALYYGNQILNWYMNSFPSGSIF